MHYIHDVIDPADTRNYIIRAPQLCRDWRTGGVGQHGLANGRAQRQPRRRRETLEK